MKSALMALALVSVTAVGVWSSGIFTPRYLKQIAKPPIDVSSCEDHYDSLLAGAKAALIRGDRKTSAELLDRAANIIPGCPALQDGPLPLMAVFHLDGGAGIPVPEKTTA